MGAEGVVAPGVGCEGVAGGGDGLVVASTDYSGLDIGEGGCGEEVGV